VRRNPRIAHIATPPRSFKPRSFGPIAGAFKTRATKLETLVKASGVGATVSINAEKPRKGCFEVSVNGKAVLTLLDMPRPFTKLKALDMEAVAADVIKACGK